MQPDTNDTTQLSAAIFRTNGIPEVSATWTVAHKGHFRFIDVRETHELQGPLGAAEGAENIPLGRLLNSVATLDAHQPTVLICRSGRRSAQAADMLASKGFAAVASVEGGMLAWNAEVLHRENVHADEKVANATNLHDAIFTTNGIPEVSGRWVQGNLGRFRLIDVREAYELSSNGRVLQAENIPLGQITTTAARWDKDAPLVVMCHSGGRSGRAVMALRANGFTNIASMEGGMMGWRAARLPVA